MRLIRLFVLAMIVIAVTSYKKNPVEDDSDELKGRTDQGAVNF